MPAHLDLAVRVMIYVVALLCYIPLTLSEVTTPVKNLMAIHDGLYESKDVLLQMLEKKLREIKDHKKRKNGNGDVLPKNVDFKLKSNGISAVGDAELLLRYGKNGQGTVNLTGDGISNVGKVQLTVGTGENGIHIPGLNNLFAGPVLNDAEQLPQVSVGNLNSGFRRQSNTSNVTNAAKVDEHEKENGAINAITSTSPSSTTVPVSVANNATSNVNVIPNVANTPSQTVANISQQVATQ